ncbi:MAG: DUF456 domain-containing protein [Candidatus Rokuibacteriota bacterium]
MDALTAIGIVVALLFAVGLVGSVVPWMPGPLFILAGAVLWAFATDFAEIGVGRLAILAALAVASFLLNFIVGALGARRYGGSRWAVVGALVGAVVGFFFGPLGLLIGPVLGAIGAELLRGADLQGGVRSGFGALVGVLLGIAADFTIVLVMIGLFVWWVWRG